MSNSDGTQGQSWKDLNAKPGLIDAPHWLVYGGIAIALIIFWGAVAATINHFFPGLWPWFIQQFQTHVW